MIDLPEKIDLEKPNTTEETKAPEVQNSQDTEIKINNVSSEEIKYDTLNEPVLHTLVNLFINL